MGHAHALRLIRNLPQHLLFHSPQDKGLNPQLQLPDSVLILPPHNGLFIQVAKLPVFWKESRHDKIKD